MFSRCAGSVRSGGLSNRFGYSFHRMPGSELATGQQAAERPGIRAVKQMSVRSRSFSTSSSCGRRSVDLSCVANGSSVI